MLASEKPSNRCLKFSSFLAIFSRRKKGTIESKRGHKRKKVCSIVVYNIQVLTFVPAILIPHQHIATRPEWPILWECSHSHWWTARPYTLHMGTKKLILTTNNSGVNEFSLWMRIWLQNSSFDKLNYQIQFKKKKQSSLPPFLQQTKKIFPLTQLTKVKHVLL